MPIYLCIWAFLQRIVTNFSYYVQFQTLIHDYDSSIKYEMRCCSMGKLLEITAAMADCQRREDEQKRVLLGVYYNGQPEK